MDVLRIGAAVYISRSPGPGYADGASDNSTKAATRFSLPR